MRQRDGEHRSVTAVDELRERALVAGSQALEQVTSVPAAAGLTGAAAG